MNVKGSIRGSDDEGSSTTIRLGPSSSLLALSERSCSDTNIPQRKRGRVGLKTFWEDTYLLKIPHVYSGSFQTATYSYRQYFDTASLAVACTKVR